MTLPVVPTVSDKNEWKKIRLKNSLVKWKETQNYFALLVCVFTMLLLDAWKTRMVGPNWIFFKWYKLHNSFFKCTVSFPFRDGCSFELEKRIVVHFLNCREGKSPVPIFFSFIRVIRYDLLYMLVVDWKKIRETFWLLLASKYFLGVL